MIKNSYGIKKEKIWNMAKQWQWDTFCKNGCNDVFWSELAKKQFYFEKLGKRYGLLKKFRENGIC